MNISVIVVVLIVLIAIINALEQNKDYRIENFMGTPVLVKPVRADRLFVQPYTSYAWDFTTR